jgi:hypothetical protein
MCGGFLVFCDFVSAQRAMSLVREIDACVCVCVCGREGGREREAEREGERVAVYAHTAQSMSLKYHIYTRSNAGEEARQSMGEGINHTQR